MDGTWVFPVDDEPAGAADERAPAEGASSSRHLVVFLEPERCLALTGAGDLSDRFQALGREYVAGEEMVVFDWMLDDQGTLVGVRNLLPPEPLVRAWEAEGWPYATREAEEIRVWFSEARAFDPSRTVHRCVFADLFQSEEGRLALAYDAYALEPAEVRHLEATAARWVPVATAPSGAS